MAAGGSVYMGRNAGWGRTSAIPCQPHTHIYKSFLQRTTRWGRIQGAVRGYKEGGGERHNTHHPRQAQAGGMAGEGTARCKAGQGGSMNGTGK